MGTCLALSSGMLPSCPHCTSSQSASSAERKKIILNGYFYRRSDGKRVGRFKCKTCNRGFSYATLNDCYRQNKRHKNNDLKKLLGGGSSLRNAARFLNLSRTTVARKLVFLGQQAKAEMQSWLEARSLVTEMQFDDLETFEHTKCKPISVTIAVEAKTRKILGIEVSQMPCRGPLAKKSRAKYEKRKDMRAQARAALFTRIKSKIAEHALIKSDENPHYPKAVQEFFPTAKHEKYKGRRGCVTGYGELKTGGFDPLFSLNHTFAMCRYNVKRLARRTWCTTKKMENLSHHLALYAVYHNSELTK